MNEFNCSFCTAKKRNCDNCIFVHLLLKMNDVDKKLKNLTF